MTTPRVLWLALAASLGHGGRARAAEEAVDAESEAATGRNVLSAKLAWLQITSPGEPEDLRRLGLSLSYERDEVVAAVGGAFRF